MNELELIREFRSEVPYPDAATMGRARAAVLPQPRRPRWPFALVVAATAAAAALAIVVLPSGSPESAAAAVLKRTAGTAAGQSGSAPPRAGQFVYTKSRSLNESVSVSHGKATSVFVEQTREAWIGTDGSGRLRESSGNSHSDEPFRPGGLFFLDLSKLPTDPAALKKLIEERKIEDGPPGDAETFTIVGDLLRETYASPQLRSALYEVAAELPGVELIGDVRDQQGRSGTAVGYTENGESRQLIFDPKTSAVLGERTVRNGKVVTWTVYLASAVVDSTSATS